MLGIEEEAMSQGMQVTGSWKRQGNNSPLGPPEGEQPPELPWTSHLSSGKGINLCRFRTLRFWFWLQPQLVSYYLSGSFNKPVKLLPWSVPTHAISIV